MAFAAIRFLMVFATSAAVLVAVSSITRAGDFFADHDSLFRNQELCSIDRPEQVRDFGRFIALYEAVKADTKSVEVVEYGASSTEIEDKSTNERCAVILHEDCFSSHCY